MSGKIGVFICPSCQAVVRSEKPLEEGLICGECQFGFGKAATTSPKKVNPVPRGRNEQGSASVMRDLTAKKTTPIRAVGMIEPSPIPAKATEAAAPESTGKQGDEEIVMPDGSRLVRRRKKRPKKEQKKSLYLFLAGWIFVVAVVFVLFQSGKIGGEVDSPTEAPPEAKKGPTATEIEILNQSIPFIAAQVSEFLNYETLDGREQFIDRSADLSLEFNRFYRQTAFPKPASKLSRIGANVLNFSDTAVAIESIWGDQNGSKWGTVHTFNKREGWKLDWEAFAPYSTESWSKFRARLGSKEGVFRLLVRRRRTSDQSKKISLSFYRAPRVFETDDEYRNTESPEVDLLTESELGKEFLELWSDHLDGKVPYGSVLGKALDPSGYLRITVRLAWEQNQRDEDIMVLKDIIGLGWYGETIQELHQAAQEAETEEIKAKLSEAKDSE